jgi:hypothetical protein
MLHIYAHEANWTALLESLKEHPEESLLQINSEPFLKSGEGPRRLEDLFLYDVRGIAPIHLVVTRHDPPPEVLRELLILQTGGTRLVTSDARSALHYALYTKKSAEIIKILVSADPVSATWQDSRNMNSFHIVAQFQSQPDVLSTVLDNVQPHLVESALLACDEKGRRPLGIACEVAPLISKSDFALMYHASPALLTKSTLEAVCSSYKKHFHAALSVKPVLKKPVSDKDPTTFCNPRKRVSIEDTWLWRPSDTLALWIGWHKVFSLLGADANDTAAYPLLHACMELDPDCHTIIFPCILSLNPFYACQLKGQSLPIHLACRLARDTDSWRKRLEALLRIYPKGSSIVDFDGCVPLEIIIKRERSSWKLVRVVLQHNPVALARVNLAERYYPPLLEKLQACPDGASTIFELLRSTPTLVVGTD